MNIMPKIDEAMDVCFVAKPENRAAAVAISNSGEVYKGAQFDSATKLLTFSPEHTALLSAVQHKDYDVSHVVAYHPSGTDSDLVSPLNLKIIVDFMRRTGKTIGYTVVDTDGSTLFAVDDVLDVIPFYRPSLATVHTTLRPEANHQLCKGESLRQFALDGLTRAFTTHVGASRYGAAVRTPNGDIYTSGQYSSFEGRLNIHAEVGALIAAVLAGETNFSELAVISDKQKDVVCQTCGACLQFLSEVSTQYGSTITIQNHASRSEDNETHTLSECLPYAWSPSNE